MQASERQMTIEQAAGSWGQGSRTILMRYLYDDLQKYTWRGRNVIIQSVSTIASEFIRTQAA